MDHTTRHCPQGTLPMIFGGGFKCVPVSGFQGALSGVLGGSTARTLWGALSLASSAASTYHGYKRNQSIGWALVWGLLGGLFPVVTPTIAVAQGFGARKKR